ncbi:halocyanin domain-containing protein [Haloglomus litoreum]|uniref:halocyanin domain-containing protein n=1 Tax=Haloglomus litoreum TaxID=3034026 RepID=UPI0023E843E5|nr:halocyanin domain-containing protein [Haloglomus sp. DT116]
MPTRRQVLGATGAALAGTTLAGTAAAQPGTDLTDWFAKTSNATEVADKRGQDTVTVTVGAAANGGDWGFAPAAVRVDPGTTVRWEWTGKGGAHNVVASDGTFESKLVQEEGHTFEWTPESAGVTKYYCAPHKAMGMRGAVIVGGTPVTVTDATPTAAAASGGSGDDGPPARTFDGWLAETDNYDGVVDKRGQDEVTVQVGAEGNGGPFAFEPAAVHASPGTTVVWEWVGPKQYDVLDPDLGIESETIASSGYRYAAQLDGDGLAKYTCSKYGDSGMRGVVLVGDGPVQELTTQGAAGAGGVAALVAASLGWLYRFNDGAATTTDPEDVRRG